MSCPLTYIVHNIITFKLHRLNSSFITSFILWSCNEQPMTELKISFPPLSSLMLLKPTPTKKCTANILHHFNNVSLSFQMCTKLFHIQNETFVDYQTCHYYIISSLILVCSVTMMSAITVALMCSLPSNAITFVLKA